MADKKKRGAGLGLRRGRKANALDAFVEGEEEKGEGESGSERPPKPIGKGIVWREKGWQRRLTVYLEPDQSREFEQWCLDHGHSYSEGAALALEMLLTADDPAE